MSDEDTGDTGKLTRRLTASRIRDLRDLKSEARIDTIAEGIAWGFEVLSSAEEAKDQNGALRVIDKLIESLRKEDQHVGAETAKLAEKHAELLKELRALKRGSGVLAGTLPEGDEGDNPVH